MTKRLVIIDGMSVFYRGFYAMPNLSTKDGTPTGGVYGFAVMALEIVKKLKPDYVCVAWDKPKTNIRSRLALYDQYKAGRKAPPPDFYAQLPLLHDLLDSLGWPLYEADDYEADDLMGAFAMQAGKKGIESYLVTSDLDVLQLVNPHTHIYTVKKGFSNIELFNEASFREKYGVGAHQWVDVKALKGDSSDNIPGVAGVGEKTALELIKQYDTLEGVYENLELLKPTLKTKLETHRDMAFLSKKLVTLQVDAPVHIDLDKAKRTVGLTPEFAAMLRKLEFRSLLRQAEAAVPKEELQEAQAEISTLEKAKQVPLDEKLFNSDKPRVLAIDQEATELWVSFVPGTYSILPLSEAKKLKPTEASYPVIGHDLKGLFRTLLTRDIQPPKNVLHDTRIGAFLLDSLQRSRELTDLLDQPVDTEDAGSVIAAIWKIYDDQKVQFDELPKLNKLAQEIEFPSIYLLAVVENRGILLDSDYLADMSKDFEKKIGALERRIYAQAGKEFNISSPVQLAGILYGDLGLPTHGVKRGKTGVYSTGAVELDKLRPLHPIVDFITQYREFTKLKSTYVDALPKLVDEQGRLHTTYALDVAATGRLSSHDPNLQNIPTRTEIGQAIRTAFVPAPGNVFISADYSQFELRLAAIMAEDQKMMEEFNQDIDIHAATAAAVQGVPLGQVDKEMRRRAKAVNFGILYGMSAHGLSVATGMSVFEAKEFIDKYFELRYPLKVYMQETARKAEAEGFVETIFGRRRPTPDMKSSNFMVREAARRAAINMPIQGTEADLMKLAMLKVEEAIEGLGHQVLQIHDSILVECPAKNAKKVIQILKDTMENVYDLPVNLKVDVKTGKNWGDL
ncbi:MAG: DNA polymerase I [Candidatus Saccharimonadales bacterium]